MTRKKENMIAVSAVVPKSIYEILRKRASERNVSVAEIVQQVIKEYLDITDLEGYVKQKITKMCNDTFVKSNVIADSVSNAVNKYLDQFETKLKKEAK